MAGETKRKDWLTGLKEMTAEELDAAPCARKSPGWKRKFAPD
jgi:hypothetical protein